MKIINLARGQGKTARLLYASEFNEIPILCGNKRMKESLLHRAREMNLEIPEPIIIEDIFSNKLQGNHEEADRGVLVDDAELILQELLYRLGVHGEIRGITLTKPEKGDLTKPKKERTLVPCNLAPFAKVNEYGKEDVEL